MCLIVYIDMPRTWSKPLAGRTWAECIRISCRRHSEPWSINNRPRSDQRANASNPWSTSLLNKLFDVDLLLTCCVLPLFSTFDCCLLFVCFKLNFLLCWYIWETKQNIFLIYLLISICLICKILWFACLFCLFSPLYTFSCYCQIKKKSKFIIKKCTFFHQKQQQQNIGKLVWLLKFLSLCGVYICSLVWRVKIFSNLLQSRKL